MVFFGLLLIALFASSLLLVKTAYDSRRLFAAVDRARAEGLIDGSLAMCTSLAPLIGYEAAASIAKEAYRSGKTVRQVALDQKVLDADKLAEVLDPRSMLEPDEN